MHFNPGRHAAQVLIAASTMIVAGCTTAYNSGIDEKGPNNYFLSIRTPSSKGGGDESLRQVKAQAEAHCAKSGRASELTRQEVGPVTADVFFTCIAK
jgi:hypothetical protein